MIKDFSPGVAIMIEYMILYLRAIHEVKLKNDMITFMVAGTTGCREEMSSTIICTREAAEAIMIASCGGLPESRLRHAINYNERENRMHHESTEKKMRVIRAKSSGQMIQHIFATRTDVG